jgi:hypothetical protein
MSDTRLELVEPCEHGKHGVSVMNHWWDDPLPNDPKHQIFCLGGSRRVLSVPTDQMVEAGNQAWHEGWAAWWKNGEPDWSDPDEAGRRIVTEILTAAFNTLGIQEKADTTLNK